MKFFYLPSFLHKLAVFIMLMLGGYLATAAVPEAVRLACDYRVDPAGVQLPAPCLQWELRADQRNTQQIAYQILVSDNEKRLNQNEGTTWNSQKVISPASIQVRYVGTPLLTGRTYYWKVRVWDNHGQASAWSPTARWQMGLLAAQDWQGVLLYAASPQFTPSDDVKKWQRAYEASQQAKSILDANGFGLNASYDQLWFQEVNNPEAVMITGFNNSQGAQNKKNNTYDNQTRPAYTGTGGGSNLPTWDLVQAYPMLDGKKPGESTAYPYSMQLFYKNRDPRFAKTIAYNGATWPLNGNNNYRIWTYLKGSTSVETSRPTNTSFYLRKAVSPTLNPSDAQYAGTDWIEIRYAEVLLNLAESACGANNITEAYTQLKAIRKRAGIQAGTGSLYGLTAGMSRAQMFEAILYERQIELAFEGKRFWDLRRWKLIEKTLNGKRREGLTITLKSTAPADFATTRDNIDLDLAYANYFTVATKVLDTRYPIQWQPTYYFFALPQSAIDNNPSLLQNNTWGGSFNPLQ